MPRASVGREQYDAARADKPADRRRRRGARGQRHVDASRLGLPRRAAVARSFDAAVRHDAPTRAARCRDDLRRSRQAIPRQCRLLPQGGDIRFRSGGKRLLRSAVGERGRWRSARRRASDRFTRSRRRCSCCVRGCRDGGFRRRHRRRCSGWRARCLPCRLMPQLARAGRSGSDRCSRRFVRGSELIDKCPLRGRVERRRGRRGNCRPVVRRHADTLGRRRC